MSGIKPLLKLNVPDKYKNSFLKKISWLTELLGRVISLCKNINLRITITVYRGCKPINDSQISVRVRVGIPCIHLTI